MDSWPVCLWLTQGSQQLMHASLPSSKHAASKTQLHSSSGLRSCMRHFLTKSKALLPFAPALSGIPCCSWLTRLCRMAAVSIGSLAAVQRLACAVPQSWAKLQLLRPNSARALRASQDKLRLCAGLQCRYSIVAKVVGCACLMYNS